LPALRARIAAPADRRQLLTHLRQRATDWDDQLVVKVGHQDNKHLIGRSIGELARERGRDPADTALDLVSEDGQFWVAPHIKRQADLDALIAHPLCVPVTDGMAAHPVKHRPLGLMPKTFGTVPLVLGDYVRERRVLSLAQAIVKLTRLAAIRAGLLDRGLLAPGLAADVVVFDPERIANEATDDDPAVAPSGVDHVLVNGSWAVRDGRLTGTRTGQVLAA
jgi:N-acyl-D-aspartate/D-glutamate deacylase